MKFLKIAIAATVIIASSGANAALIERLGGLAYYDDVADLTWLADANYAKTSGYHASGAMTWADANNWAAGLSVGGVDGWRLANTVDVGNDGATYTNQYQGVDFGWNITTHSEMSNMFYNVLGNMPNYDTSGVNSGCTSLLNGCLTNTGPFSNLDIGIYWSATEVATDTTLAWWFNMLNGAQAYSSVWHKETFHSAWAVQSGDAGLGWVDPVSAVPVPAAVWLFGSGLIGLVGFARRKKA